MVAAIAIAKSAETPTARDFIAKAKAMPYLTPDEETAAARRLEEHGDSAARDLLVNSHLRQVVKMAMALAKYGFSAEDLIQEGNMGLMTAVEKFDVSKGYRLTTYATWWIKAFMADYMMKNRSSIRIPNTLKNKKVLMLLGKAKTALASGNGSVVAVYKKIAKACECDVDTVRIIHALSTGTKSFSDPINQEEGNGEFGDFIPDTGPLPEEIVADSDERFARHSILQRAVTTLNERESAIFKWRRMVDEDDIKTLETLSVEFGVSRERIRQIEVGAFEKVQAFIRKEELARRGEELARIAVSSTPVTKPATDTPKMILSTVTEPKKIAAPKKTPGWNVITRNGERQLVFCQ